MNKRKNEGLVQDKLICSTCTDETFLKQQIRNDGEVGVCAYCGKKRKAITIGDLADRFDGAFERHFYRTSTEPNDYEYMLLKDRESSYDFERHGDPVLEVIQEIGEVAEAIAHDLLEVLSERHGDYEKDKMGEENDFDSESRYAPRETSIVELYSEWRAFQLSVKVESRYFNSTAERFLDNVFRELGEDGTRDGGKAIVDGGPGTATATLFRARVFQSDPALQEALKRPDRELASPPFRYAKAGRMNAHGISLFYGATDRSCAIAEVRPPVGSRVMTSEFRILRRIRLLDLDVLRSLEVNGSYFDSWYQSSLQRASFLGFMSQEMSKPVMPDDEQFLYLPTQVIADYLANSRFQLDGIIYPSVQGQGGMKNVVLFHDAGKVKEFAVAPTTEISVDTSIDLDQGASYWVFVSTDEVAEKKAGKTKRVGTPFTQESHDYRVDTLELSPGSVRVHHIQGVAFTCEDFEVRRHTSTKKSLLTF